MSVEYALMLVLVSGVVLSGLGFALRDSLWEFTRCFQGELIGAGCDGSTLPAEAPGAEGSTETEVVPSDPAPSPCDDANAETSPTTPPPDASTPDPTPTDCPTPTVAP